MFAVLINHIESNAGRELALIMQAFLMSADIVLISKRYRHPGTPVWSVNAPTAFDSECDKQRERPGCFFFTLCYKNRVFSTAHCLAPMRRQLTKRASFQYSTRTACASTQKTASVADVHRPPVRCAASSLTNWFRTSRTSVPSKSKTPAFYSLPASKGIVAAPSTAQPTPYTVWPDSFAETSPLYLHSHFLTG